VIRWIQQRNWLPEAALAAFVFLLLGGLDLITQGITAMLGSLAIATSLLFVRRLSYLASALVLAAAVIQISFSLLPIFGSIGIPLLAFVVGAFSPKPWREINFVVSIFGGLVFAANVAFNPTINLEIFGGVVQLDDLGRVVIFITLSLLAISLVSLLWILGQLLITRLVHVGTEFDRLVYEEKQLKLSVELAEQSKRFEIARDINETVVQKLSSVITNAEGGIYAAKSNPEAGLRALEKVLDGARVAHTELRRLFDMINRGTATSTAPPTLADLESLAITMREIGLDVAVSNFGERFPLNQSAELAIYRIIFEALQNVKQHNPAGTKAAVEISWLENGLQVLIKDNGVEVERRSALGPNGLPVPYEAKDDLDTLLEKVSGPGLTAMRERAESFGGSLEVQRVVGIGFTVSAMFPASGVGATSDSAF
jgi:signal transduction histidine kinase